MVQNEWSTSKIYIMPHPISPISSSFHYLPPLFNMLGSYYSGEDEQGVCTTAVCFNNLLLASSSLLLWQTIQCITIVSEVNVFPLKHLSAIRKTQLCLHVYCKVTQKLPHLLFCCGHSSVIPRSYHTPTSILSLAPPSSHRLVVHAITNVSPKRLHLLGCSFVEFRL